MGFISPVPDFPEKLGIVAVEASAFGIYSIPGWFYAWGTTYVVGAGTIYYIPIFVARTTTYTGIATDVVTAAGAGSVARMGIYQCAAGNPAGLVLDAGTVACDSTGNKEISITQTLNRGWYFLAIVTNDSSPTLRAMDSTYSVSAPLGAYGTSIGAGGPTTRLALMVGSRLTDAANGLVTPAPAPAASIQLGSLPLVWLKDV